MTFNSKKEALEYMQRNGVDISTLNDEFWQSVNISSAQPEFQVIAEMLYDLYNEATFETSSHHVPFEKEIIETYTLETLSSHPLFSYQELVMKISASMCAKLSYNTQDNTDTIEKHLERANMLQEHKHWEPFSHQAITMNQSDVNCYTNTLKMSRQKYEDSKHKLGDHVAISNDNKMSITKYGVCYNLRGFISQRYLLENF